MEFSTTSGSHTQREVCREIGKEEKKEGNKGYVVLLGLGRSWMKTSVSFILIGGRRTDLDTTNVATLIMIAMTYSCSWL